MQKSKMSKKYEIVSEDMKLWTAKTLLELSIYV